MPEKATIERAKQDESEGKSPSTQAGEFVHEEIEHVREGKHGARSTKQAIAIGLSKARRQGAAHGHAAHERAQHHRHRQRRGAELEQQQARPHHLEDEGGRAAHEERRVEGWIHAFTSPARRS